jgi:putative membrane protein
VSPIHAGFVDAVPPPSPLLLPPDDDPSPPSESHPTAAKTAVPSTSATTAPRAQALRTKRMEVLDFIMVSLFVGKASAKDGLPRNSTSGDPPFDTYAVFIGEKRTWIRTIFSGMVLPHIWRRVLTVTVLSIGTTVLYRSIPAVHISLTQTPFALIGLPLGIFLGFRNSAAYDRFWEARKLWGSLVNTSRSLTRQVLTLIGPLDAEGATVDDVNAYRERFVHTLVLYVHCLRLHLRGEAFDHPTEHRLATDVLLRTAQEPNVPYAILHEMGELLRGARARAWISELHVPVVEASLTSLTDVQGACERIKSTPIPFSYTVLMHRIVAVYCMLLPFGVADSIGWATPVVVLFVSYALFGLDAIGEEIEQPFGLDTNDLPLSSISRTIEINLRARLGEPDLPKPVKPKHGILV